jgi:ferric-dicitrate binding protein FerR (iron transport regulator)
MSMQPSAERMRYLLHRYLDGSCTREELEELYAAMAREEDEQVHRLIDEAFAELQPGSAVQDVDWDHMFNRIVKSRPAKTRKITWWKYAAAVVLLLLAGAGFMYHYMHHNTQLPVQAAQALVHDAAPGTNKAVLTLADGSTVALDSAGTRTMQQGSTAIQQQGGALQYNVHGNEVAVSYNTLTTPRGGQFQLTLPDGTKVWLNAASSLKFPVAFRGPLREVTLTGEAYFEVAHNAKQRFIVHTARMDITDLGTRFNVMAYYDEAAVKTTLVEGAVNISDGKKNALLKPGQQAVIDKNSNSGIKVQAVDVEEAIAWKNGEFYFNHTSIYEIMRQVSRWYDVEVTYQDSLDAYLSGNIRKNVNVSEVFKMLELAGGLHFRVDDKKATVMK